jgi:hypothetical protein
MSRRNIIVNVTEFSSASHVDWEHDLRFCTIVVVDSTPVFLLSDITRAMSHISPDTHVHASLTVAEYPPDLSTQASPLPQIALDQLRAVHHILHGWDLADHVLLVMSANTSTMASCNVHTRRTCLKGPQRVLDRCRICPDGQASLLWDVWSSDSSLGSASFGSSGPPDLAVLSKRQWHVQSQEMYE